MQTVKIEDLDRKMHDLVSREEFHGLIENIKQQADKEKQELDTKIEELKVENNTLKTSLDNIETKLYECAKLATYTKLM